MKLSDLGEFGLIERIRQSVAANEHVVRGIGDDAAELDLPAGHHLLTSTDLLIEDVHFRLDWTDAESLGHKAIAVNCSDLAAMGATPRFLYLGLACPPETEIALIDRFLQGVLDEIKVHGAVLVGGDTCRSSGPWLISVTVEGSAPKGVAIGRGGARVGDLILVSGSLGDSALALQMRSKGIDPPAELWERHIRPQARVRLGNALADCRRVTAMIDISDGLAADLEHILQASEVGGVLELERLPLSEAFGAQQRQAPELIELAIHGGEDYELLFTVPPEAVTEVTDMAHRIGEQVTVIGSITPRTGELVARDAHGQVRPILVKGYDHFCRSGV